MVWWEKGFFPQADEAVTEIVAAFEQDTGKEVELVQPEQAEIQERAEAALAAGQPPDFLFSSLSQRWIPRWAYEDRFTNLEGVLGPALGLFDADAIEVSMLLNGKHGPAWPLRLADGPGFQPHPCLEQPPGARRLHPRGHPKGMGGVLVILVRPGAAGGAPGHGARGHLGRRAAHVGRGDRRHRQTNSSSSSSRTRRPGSGLTAGFRSTIPRYAREWSRR